LYSQIGKGLPTCRSIQLFSYFFFIQLSRESHNGRPHVCTFGCVVVSNAEFMCRSKGVTMNLNHPPLVRLWRLHTSLINLFWRLHTSLLEASHISFGVTMNLTILPWSGFGGFTPPLVSSLLPAPPHHLLPSSRLLLLLLL